MKYPKYYMCIDGVGTDQSLQTGKVYRVLRPQKNDPPYDLRVIDEEGEDYLYPAERFVEVQLPPAGRRLVNALAATK